MLSLRRLRGPSGSGDENGATARTLSESLAQVTPKRANIHWKKGPSRRGLTSSSAMRAKLRAKRGIFEETGSHVGFLGR